MIYQNKKSCWPNGNTGRNGEKHMKKNNGNNGSKSSKGTGAAPERCAFEFRKLEKIMGDKFENENKVVFDLVERQGGRTTVTLTLYPGDGDYDNGVLDLFGITIRVTARSGKSGMFLSFPSYKGKDGDYHDHVTVYDKNFHAIVKEVLTAYYADES